MSRIKPTKKQKKSGGTISPDQKWNARKHEKKYMQIGPSPPFLLLHSHAAGENKETILKQNYQQISSSESRRRKEQPCAYHSFYGLNKSPQQINTRGWSAHLYPTSRWCGTTFWLHTIDWGENDSLIIIVPVFFILCSQIPANVLMLRARALGENIFAMKRSSGDDGNEKEKKKDITKLER